VRPRKEGHRARRGSTVAASAPASPWIQGRWRDLALFIAPPVVILPGVLLAQTAWSSKNIYALVMALGALGHHLPGMMRAYGDRELFRRFHLRFILAPLFLVAVCASFGLRDTTLAPILLLTYFWGVWHGLMQTHGFARIYDAKAGSFATTTVHLDRWLCITWFGAGVLFSTSRMHHVLQKFYASGGPAVPFEAVEAARFGWGAVTVLVTIAWLMHLGGSMRAGRTPSALKIALLATSIGFWWTANAVVENLLLGLVLFEIFHDVQYLAIVWIYNRRRVDTDVAVGRFTRFLFRDRRALVFLYVGLVFAYGALSFVPAVPGATWSTLFTATLAASTLLHFYYDSFIWKVREKPTRVALGLAGGREIGAARGTAWRWAAPALRWSAFVVPAAYLAWAGVHPRQTQHQSMHALGIAFPNYPLAQNNLAVFKLSHDDPAGAVRIARRVLAMRPRDTDLDRKARENLRWGLVGTALQSLQRGQTHEAEIQLLEAASLDPHLGTRLAQDARGFARRGEHWRADLYYRAVLVVEPNDVQLHSELARELSAAAARATGG
jgi:hypothetical protein